MNDREKLVKEKLELTDVISYAIRDYDAYMDECRETETPPIDSFEDFIADGAISAGYRKQEWISASDPPKSIINKVIVLCKNGYRGFGHYEKICDKGVWYNLESGVQFTDWDLSYEVTHWCELPQPPKGE